MSWIGFIVGVGLTLFTWTTVMKTLVFTRSGVPLLEQGVILGLRYLYARIGRLIASAESRDNFLSTMAPGALLAQLAAWLALFFVASALMFWPFLDGGFAEAARASGSSLFTLGISGPAGQAPTAFIFLTAATGIVVVALYIAYLPTLYGQFNAREAAVSQLESVIGAPPWGPTVLTSHREHGLIEGLPSLYARWDQLAAEVGVAITHYPLLAWFRGPNASTSWPTSLLAVLDSAALYTALMPADAPLECRAVVRTAAHTLDRVSKTMSFAVNATALAERNAEVGYADFLPEYERLRASGLPVAREPEEAWAAFCETRQAYAPQLLALADAVLAPASPWSEAGRA